jgi:hypothetical protein
MSIGITFICLPLFWLKGSMLCLKALASSRCYHVFKIWRLECQSTCYVNFEDHAIGVVINWLKIWRGKKGTWIKKEGQETSSSLRGTQTPWFKKKNLLWWKPNEKLEKFLVRFLRHGWGWIQNMKLRVNSKVMALLDSNEYMRIETKQFCVSLRSKEPFKYCNNSSHSTCSCIFTIC